MPETKIISVKRLPRFLNVGENPKHIPKDSGWIGHRQWKGCIRYGFISAGQGVRYSQPLQELKAGDYIAAYITGEGYVGIGEIKNVSIAIKNFEFDNLKFKDFKIEKTIVDNNSKTSQPVEELTDIRKTLFRNCLDQKKTEYAVKIDWVKVVDREHAFWRKNFGLFASRLTQCSLDNQPKTIDFIEECFKVKFQLV